MSTNLSKRIAQALTEANRNKRRAQKEESGMDGPPPREHEQKDPKVKILDELYDCVQNQDCDKASSLIGKLTKALHLEEEVAFEVQDEEEDEPMEHEDKPSKHHPPFGRHHKEESEEEEPSMEDEDIGDHEYR